MSECRSCQHPIDWIKLKSGKMHPVDNKIKLTIVTQDGRIEQGWESHFSTCPAAKDWRGKGR